MRTKTKKFRGSMTHGRGRKGGRGAGLRGGRGNAGLHKHKFMHMMKYMPDHFGAHGFKRPQSIIKKTKTINVGDLEEKYPGKKEIDLGKEGYDKLLGAGTLKSKLKIMVNSASENALTKIKEKGGEVILPEKQEKKTTQTPKELSAPIKPAQEIKKEITKKTPEEKKKPEKTVKKTKPKEKTSKKE